MGFFNNETSLGILNYEEGHYNNINVTGIATVKDKVTAEKVNIIGLLHVEGCLSAKQIFIKGGVDCPQKIIAENIKLDVSGNVRIEELEAKIITISRKEENGILKINKIACEQLLAEDLTCKEIITETAELKKKCNIQKLYYKKLFTKSEETIIEKAIKLT